MHLALLLLALADSDTWKVSEIKDPMDDSVSVVAAVAGDRPGTQLAVWCRKGEAELSFETGSKAIPARSSARIRFGALEPRAVLTTPSTDLRSVLVRDRWAVEQLLLNEKMLFEFVPLGAQAEVTMFATGGLMVALGSGLSTCGIDPSEVGDSGIFVLLITPKVESEAREIAKKLADKVETTVVPAFPGAMHFYVTAGRFKERSGALALVNQVRERQSPGWMDAKVGRINTKGTRVLD
jgi:hypothetical protein